MAAVLRRAMWFELSGSLSREKRLLAVVLDAGYLPPLHALRCTVELATSTVVIPFDPS